MGEDWPWQYSFPPFFTLQPHSATREKQLEAWRHLVLTYCQNNNLATLNLSETEDLPLFHNSAISRRLSPEGIQAVLEDLSGRGNLEWTDKAKTRCYIYWKSPQHIGQELFSWVQESGQTGTVLTVHELLHGDETEGRSWHKLDQAVFIKALRTLEKDRKAEVFDDEEGVKFFK